jgi:hypothetical protein
MHSRHVVLDRQLPRGELSEAGLDDIGGPRSAYLLRPYLDLSPFESGPSLVTTVESAFRQLADEDSPRLMIQTHPAPDLRAGLIREIGLPAYWIRLAGQLPARLRTPRWLFLMEMISAAERTGGLSAEQRVRLATLLNTLGLYDETARLFADARDSSDSRDPAAATLAIRHALAVHRSQPSAEAEQFNVRTLRAAAENKHGDLYVRLGASTTLVAWFAKGRQRDLEQVTYWRTVAERLYPSLTPQHGMPDVLYASTYWRAVSFCRYLQKDYARTAEELDLAERYAVEFQPANDTEWFTWAQNMHPLLETRTREAFDAGDLTLAEQRAARLLEVDPLCAKSHGHAGNLRLAANAPADALARFRAAANLGAPYTAFAWFMIGHCAELLGDRLGAQLAWVEATRADPGCIDARQRLHALGTVDDIAGDAVPQWAASSIASIGRQLRLGRATSAASAAPSSAEGTSA